MIERQTELKRRHKRKKKMRLLKEKLKTVQGPDREKVLYKIHRLSPFWTEEGSQPKGPKADRPERAEEPKKKPAPRAKKA